MGRPRRWAESQLKRGTGGKTGGGSPLRSTRLAADSHTNRSPSSSRPFMAAAHQLRAIKTDFPIEHNLFFFFFFRPAIEPPDSILSHYTQLKSVRHQADAYSGKKENFAYATLSKWKDGGKRRRKGKKSLYNQIMAYNALQAEPSHREDDDGLFFCLFSNDCVAHWKTGKGTVVFFYVLLFPPSGLEHSVKSSLWPFSDFSLAAYIFESRFFSLFSSNFEYRKQIKMDRTTRSVVKEKSEV